MSISSLEIWRFYGMLYDMVDVQCWRPYEDSMRVGRRHPCSFTVHFKIFVEQQCLQYTQHPDVISYHATKMMATATPSWKSKLQASQQHSASKTYPLPFFHTSSRSSQHTNHAETTTTHIPSPHTEVPQDKTFQAMSLEPHYNLRSTQW